MTIKIQYNFERYAKSTIIVFVYRVAILFLQFNLRNFIVKTLFNFQL